MNMPEPKSEKKLRDEERENALPASLVKRRDITKFFLPKEDEDEMEAPTPLLLRRVVRQ